MHQWDPLGGVRTETLGVSSGQGTSMTAGGSANTKGSYHSVVTTGFTWEHLVIALELNSAAADYMVDIAIQVGGNNGIIVPDLHFVGARAANEHHQHFELPLHIPAGASLCARIGCSTASATARIAYCGFSRGIGGRPGYSRVVALFSPSSSRGVTVDPGSGSTHTKNRTQLIASSPERVAALFGVIGYAGDIAKGGSADSLLDIETGASGQERVLCGNLPLSWNSTLDGVATWNTPLIPCDVPAGERFSANYQSATNTAGDRLIDLSLYGLVP